MRAVALSTIIVLLAAGFTACSSQELTVHDAWIPLAPPTVSALAGYMRIDNRSGEARTLVAADGALFGRIEIHQTIYDKDSGLARMISQDTVSIAPGSSFVFEPGGYHLMLINPRRALREKDSVPLTLIFADGSRSAVAFEVRRQPFRL